MFGQSSFIPSRKKTPVCLYKYDSYQPEEANNTMWEEESKVDGYSSLKVKLYLLRLVPRRKFICSGTQNVPRDQENWDSIPGRGGDFLFAIRPDRF
jgi:hypothetical protein